MLQKSQEKSQAPQMYMQADVSARQQRRRQKTRLQVEWIPIQYDFPDSVLCVHRYEDTLAFGTADANVIIFNTNFDSPINFNDDSKLYNSSQIIAPFAQYRGHSGAINCITSDPKTELFASCSGDGTVHVWSFLINNGMFTSQQRHLSTDSDNSSSISTIKSNLILSHHSGPVISASWLTNGYLLTGSTDSTVCLWDVAHSQNFTHVEKLPTVVTCTDTPLCNIPIPNIKKRSSPHTNNSNFSSSSSKSSSSPIVGYAVGLSNGEVRFFDPRVNGRIMNISHSKGQIISCKFGTFDMNNVTNSSFGSGINDASVNVQMSSNGSGKAINGQGIPVQSGSSSSGKKKKKRPSSINLLYDMNNVTLNPSLRRLENQTAKYTHNSNNSNIKIPLGNSIVSNSSLTNLNKIPSPGDESASIGLSETNLTSYSFISAGSDKSVRIWDLRMPQDYIKSFDVDHVPTKIDVCGQYISVPTETGNPRFINLARSVIMPLASPPFSYTVSSCAFCSDDGSKVAMASWDGTAAIMQFEMKNV